MSTVLVCADRSDHSQNALDYYLKKIHKEGNTVKVVHCPEYWANIGPMEGPTPGRLEELRTETNANTAAIGEQCKAIVEAAGVPFCFEVLQGKEPWQEICKAAERQKANLIVVGSRGMGTLKRTLLGSVSDSVLHHAHCPVLVCRLAH